MSRSIITVADINSYLKKKKEETIWEVTAISPDPISSESGEYIKESYWVTCVLPDPTTTDRVHKLHPEMPSEYNNILMVTQYPDGFRQIGLKYAC